MYVKSSPSQQNAVTEAWTADFLVFEQAFYHWAILPPSNNYGIWQSNIYVPIPRLLHKGHLHKFVQGHFQNTDFNSFFLYSVKNLVLSVFFWEVVPSKWLSMRHKIDYDQIHFLSSPITFTKFEKKLVGYKCRAVTTRPPYRTSLRTVNNTLLTSCRKVAVKTLRDEQVK